jgi:hypothetical protein
MDKYTNEVQVWNEKQNHPIVHKNAKTYRKGDMFCVYEIGNQITYKYPIVSIWRVRETYPNKQREHLESESE